MAGSNQMVPSLLGRAGGNKAIREKWNIAAAKASADGNSSGNKGRLGGWAILLLIREGGREGEGEGRIALLPSEITFYWATDRNT